jgi:hypothetical protein
LNACGGKSYSRLYIISNKLKIVDKVVRDFVRKRLEICDIDFLESYEASTVSATHQSHSRYGTAVTTVLQEIGLAEEFQRYLVNFEITARSNVE